MKWGGIQQDSSVDDCTYGGGQVDGLSAFLLAEKKKEKLHKRRSEKSSLVRDAIKEKENIRQNSSGRCLSEAAINTHFADRCICCKIHNLVDTFIIDLVF